MSIEQEIQAKGLTAPRVTAADVEAEIAREYYFNGAEALRVSGGICLPIPEDHRRAIGCLTFCVLVLHNGCKVVGVNHGPVDPANFDAEYGRKDAREQAIAKIWPLLGFRLRDKLAAGLATAGGDR